VNTVAKPATLGQYHVPYRLSSADESGRGWAAEDVIDLTDRLVQNLSSVVEGNQRRALVLAHALVVADDDLVTCQMFNGLDVRSAVLVLLRYRLRRLEDGAV